MYKSLKQKLHFQGVEKPLISFPGKNENGFRQMFGGFCSAIRTFKCRSVTFNTIPTLKKVNRTRKGSCDATPIDQASV